MLNHWPVWDSNQQPFSQQLQALEQYEPPVTNQRIILECRLATSGIKH
jgi:hypothetical protein